jgi:hypothetical protein
MELNQIANLSDDLKLATNLAGATVMLMHLQELFVFLKGLPVIGPIVSQLGAGFSYLIGFLKPSGKLISVITWAFSNMGKVLSFVWPIIKSFAIGMMQFGAGIMAFLIPLQGLTRAIARMKIESLEWFANNAADVIQSVSKIKDAFAVILIPIQDLIKGFEEIFFAILGGTFMLDAGKNALSGFADDLKVFSEAILGVWSTLRGVVNGIFTMISTMIMNAKIMIGNLLQGNFSNIDLGAENALDNFGKAFNEEFNKSFARAQTPLVDGNVDNAKVANTVNNYDVKMTNNFKEVLQPDRIAFTIKDQLEKSSVNRTKARVSSTAGLQAGAI